MHACNPHSLVVNLHACSHIHEALEAILSTNFNITDNINS